MTNLIKYHRKLKMFRVRGDVDNQLGHIHSIVKRYLDVKDIEPLNFESCDKDFSHIFISNDVIPKELAERARNFAQQIPFDANVKNLNDDDNKPRDTIFGSFDISSNLLSYLKEATTKLEESKPNQWVWEKYIPDIYRATPLSLSAFFNSPIFELIDVLEAKWKQHLFSHGGPLLKKTTWVLQRVPQGHGIAIHDDGADHRQISFVYYLTPDDWSEEDGGQLYIQHELTNNTDNSITLTKDGTYINPTFNSMVSWNMPENKSPLHAVTEVKADNSRPRISLVGFWSS